MQTVILCISASLALILLTARPSGAGESGEAPPDGVEGVKEVSSTGEEPPPDAADKALEEKKEEARKLFLEGVALFEKKDYAAALEKFQLSFDTVPHWSSRYNIGMCHYYLGSYDDACIQLELFLTEAGEKAPAGMRQEAEKVIMKARSKLATVTFKGIDESSEITVDGKPPKKSPGGQEIYLMPGIRHVTIVSGGITLLDEDMDAAEGENKEIRVYLKESLPTKKSNHPEKKQPIPAFRAAGWSLVGLSAASLIVVAVTGGLVLSKKSKIEDLESRYPAAPALEREAMEEEASSQYREGLKLADASTAFFVIGVLAAGGGAALLILVRSMEKKTGAAGTVGLGLSPGGIFIHGSF